jgi:hypothetical protein
MKRVLQSETVHSGQAVVQMARSVHTKGLEYAIKFYVSWEAFNVEHALYLHVSGPTATGLAQFLPEVCYHQISQLYVWWD